VLVSPTEVKLKTVVLLSSSSPLFEHASNSVNPKVPKVRIVAEVVLGMVMVAG
jgi:hypothetical protein